MSKTKRSFLCILALAVSLSCLAPSAHAKDPEFDVITKHLKTQYKAKRRRIPFMGLAKLAVKMIHPAGVKSIKVAIFEELEPAPVAGSNELNTLMRSALSPEWLPLMRFRSRNGEQMYVYARDDGESVRLMVVQLDGTEAVVARLKVNPQKLKEFLENPKILGISLNP